MFYKNINLLKPFFKFKSSQIVCNALLGRTMCDNSAANDHIVWMDMEMTGLDVETCHILEITCVITNSDLKMISNNLNIVINQPLSILNNMNSWCTEYHTKTKLIEEVRNSKISLQDAESRVLKYLQNHIPRGKCPIAGNSVYMDHLFLQKYMPVVSEYLHYRIIDVSTIKELVRRWNPQIYNSVPPKRLVHRATSDIEDSIKELEYYKKYIFISQNS